MLQNIKILCFRISRFYASEYQDFILYAEYQDFIPYAEYQDFIPYAEYQDFMHQNMKNLYASEYEEFICIRIWRIYMQNMKILLFRISRFYALE